MSFDDWFFDVIGPLVVAALVLLMVAAVVGTVVSARTQSECLQAGYSDGGATILFERYCFARVNATDIVKPLSEVRRARTHR